jgi:polyisoprenoid-binding protein YceI
MKKLLALISITFLLNAQSNWSIDKAHSRIGFSVNHMVFSEVKGRFTDYEATITTSDDKLTDVKVKATIQAKSINTDNEKRDEHLRSADFFEVEKYPTITFESKSWKKVGKGKYKLNGDLTMKGVTKNITLDVTLKGVVTGMSGKLVAILYVSGSINRQDFNISWNKLLDKSTPIVGNTVTFEMPIELVKN